MILHNAPAPLRTRYPGKIEIRVVAETVIRQWARAEYLDARRELGYPPEIARCWVTGAAMQWTDAHCLYTEPTA